MAYQKIIPYLLIVVAAIAITQVSSSPKPLNFFAANKSHDLIVGFRRPGDKIVFNQIVRNTSSSSQITEQQNFVLPRPRTITLVAAYDRGYNGTGGYARIIKGGPGSNNVTLEFRKQRYGFNFQVLIYAY